MDTKIRIMLVDDHTIVRDGLKMLLGLNEAMVVCAEAGSLKEALEILPQVQADVILLDFKLPDSDGINGCTVLKRLYPKIKIIILTAFSRPDLVLETIRAGADGYLLKNIKYDILADTIRLVNQGAHILDPAVSDGVIDCLSTMQVVSEPDGLSPRQSEIIQLISCGKSNKEIAEILNISDQTVRNYISAIFKKISVTNRTEAASYWLRRKI